MTRSKLCLIVALVSVALGTVAPAAISDDPVDVVVSESTEPIFRIIEGPDPFSRTISDGPDPISGVIGERPTVINDNPDPFGAIGDDPDVVHPFRAVCFLVAALPDGALCFVGIDDSPASID